MALLTRVFWQARPDADSESLAGRLQHHDLPLPLQELYPSRAAPTPAFLLHWKLHTETNNIKFLLNNQAIVVIYHDSYTREKLDTFNNFSRVLDLL